ncbi:carbohydrate ABC transporter permease [Glycomyces xiaoerkulensis]|uniref:carbohydrate ABC transporter permease n=1 Tax=Glycomyces xiaoerkulensis TaxID=2038139 RepID=UPI001E2C096A|nr:sugar ABC transporter permease [Glycomyces xiaoerkulensis]
MLYLVVFLVVPLLQGIAMSFTDAKLINPTGGDPVGVDNYASTLTADRFWNSLLATVLYTTATVAGTVVLGTAAAVLVNRAFRGRALLRSLLAFPYAMPTVAVALVFAWMYNQSNGAFNRGLGILGIGETGWLTDPDWGMASVVAATVWKVFPFVMLVVLAALQSVSAELYEAARIDGADALNTFRSIVLPHLAPTLRIVALLMTIWSIRRFEIIFLLTGGGPVETTNTLVINVYRTAFSDQNLGVAATVGALGLVVSLAVTCVFLLVERRETKREEAL